MNFRSEKESKSTQTDEPCLNFSDFPTLEEMDDYFTNGLSSMHTEDKLHKDLPPVDDELVILHMKQPTFVSTTPAEADSPAPSSHSPIKLKMKISLFNIEEKNQGIESNNIRTKSSITFDLPKSMKDQTSHISNVTCSNSTVAKRHEKKSMLKEFLKTPDSIPISHDDLEKFIRDVNRDDSNDEQLESIVHDRKKRKCTARFTTHKSKKKLNIVEYSWQYNNRVRL